MSSSYLDELLVGFGALPLWVSVPLGLAVLYLLFVLLSVIPGCDEQ